MVQVVRLCLLLTGPPSLPFYPLITPSTFYFFFLSFFFHRVLRFFSPSEKIIFQIKKKKKGNRGERTRHTQTKGVDFSSSFFPPFSSST